MLQPSQQQPGGTSPKAIAFPYILGPAADLFFLGPGATLLVSALFVTLMVAGRDAAAGLLATALTIAFSGPHYAATYRRAYASREIIRSHPVVTVLAPVLLAIAVALALRFPATVAPLFVVLYVIWSGYHYSGQSLGLALLYPLRQGHRLDVGEKRLLAFPLYVSWLVSLVGLLRVDGAVRNSAYRVVRDTALGVRLQLPPASVPWVLGAGIALLIASFSAVALLAVRRRRRAVPLPWPVYGIVLTQAIWFGWGLFYPLLNIVLVPIFHGLQYLALTSWHQCKGRGPAGPRAFALYAGTVLLLGLVINPGLFLLIDDLPGEPLLVGALLISLLNVHHFLMDGRIWRLRERRVVESFVETAAAR
ncbi:MAG TPA: hypothetical protein VFH73_27060 [Polyangia bacterium]|nr:hypothetical protein [Polyangia bacterium]